MKSPVLWFIIFLILIIGMTAVGPAERTLGTNVRVVYLHGAWVWVALAGFLAAGAAGLVGLVTNQERWHLWSRALGRAALLFWITYLPISMWAMQTNWNGLFLAEPRFRLAAVFAIGGLLLQAGVTLMEDPVWASGANLVYAVAIMLALRLTPNVMHPAAPIVNSDAWRIQLYFAMLLLLALLAGWQVARWFRQIEPVTGLPEKSFQK